MNKALSIGYQPERIGRTIEQVHESHVKGVARTLREFVQDNSEPDMVERIAAEAEVNEFTVSVVLETLADILERDADA